MGFAYVFLPLLKLHIQNIPFYIKNKTDPEHSILVSIISKRRFFEDSPPTRVHYIQHEEIDIWNPIILMVSAYLMRERVGCDNGYITAEKESWCSNVVTRYQGDH